MRYRRQNLAQGVCVEPLEPRITLSGALPQLSVDAAGRNLVTSTGQPFFWLADTAWELFHRLNRTEAQTYLTDRANRGFNVVQAVALAELDGFNSANAYGDQPLTAGDPTTPAVTPGNDPNDAAEYDHWDHIEYVIDTAASLDIYTALLPTWGSHVNSGRVNINNAQAYGQFIGQRYANKPVIWVLGGDRQAYGRQDIWRALAKGIAIGATGGEDYSQLLMTYHAPDGDSSSLYFHDDNWLDFNMFQSGHGDRDLPNYNLIIRDWNKSPAKPTLDSEPRYESHPVAFDFAKGRYDDADVRQAAYWAVFAGGFGHTYGHHSVWQMHSPAHTGIWQPENYWYEAIHAPGADDMRHLRALMESHPLLGRVPDQSLVADAYTGGDHVRATRGDGYALIYTPTGKPLTVDLTRINRTEIHASWFNPRTGESTDIATYANTAQQAFTPPSTGRGNDWVLVLAGPDQPPPEDPPAPVVDELAPLVVQARWRLDTPLPQLELTFTEDVSQSLTPDDLYLLSLPDGVPVSPDHLAVTYDLLTHVATVRFVGYDRSMPPDGLYELSLRHYGISDAAGNALAGSFGFQFRVRIADANNDGRIDIDDYMAIDVGYSLRRTGFANGDFNVDGAINSDDYFLIDAEFLAPMGPDLVPPSVVDADFVDDPANPRLLLRFSEDVSADLSTDDFWIFNTDSSRFVYSWEMAIDYDHATDTATPTFPGMDGLENGAYELIVYSYRISDAAGNDLGTYVFDFEVHDGRPIDLQPPTVTGFQFFDQTPSRVVISFSEDLAETLGPWDFWLFNETTQTGVNGDLFNIVYDAATRASTLTFATPNSRLAPGQYTFHLWAYAVYDAAGNGLQDYQQFHFTVS